jgi:hypothetical protein
MKLRAISPPPEVAVQEQRRPEAEQKLQRDDPRYPNEGMPEGNPENRIGQCCQVILQPNEAALFRFIDQIVHETHERRLNDGNQDHERRRENGWCDKRVGKQVPSFFKHLSPSSPVSATQAAAESRQRRAQPI